MSFATHCGQKLEILTKYYVAFYSEKSETCVHKSIKVIVWLKIVSPRIWVKVLMHFNNIFARAKMCLTSYWFQTSGLWHMGPQKVLTDSYLIILDESKWSPWSSRINLVTFRNFSGPLFHKPVYGRVLFLDSSIKEGK